MNLIRLLMKRERIIFFQFPCIHIWCHTSLHPLPHLNQSINPLYGKESHHKKKKEILLHEISHGIHYKKDSHLLVGTNRVLQKERTHFQRVQREKSKKKTHAKMTWMMMMSLSLYTMIWLYRFGGQIWNEIHQIDRSHLFLFFIQFPNKAKDQKCDPFCIL